LPALWAGAVEASAFFAGVDTTLKTPESIGDFVNFMKQPNERKPGFRPIPESFPSFQRLPESSGSAVMPQSGRVCLRAGKAPGRRGHARATTSWGAFQNDEDVYSLLPPRRGCLLRRRGVAAW
jgi:hypothetical protein